MIIEDNKLKFTSAEIALIKYIRKLGYGRITIIISNSCPKAIEQAISKSKLTTEEPGNSGY